MCAVTFRVTRSCPLFRARSFSRLTLLHLFRVSLFRSGSLFMAHQSSSEDSQLIADLVALSNKSPKLVKSSAYPAPSDPSLLVVSWKMNEFKYYDIPSPFPTYARGLFAIQPNPAESRYRIVARGYDKFFNIGEVPWTEVCLSSSFYNRSYPPSSGLSSSLIRALLTFFPSSQMGASSSLLHLLRPSSSSPQSILLVPSKDIQGATLK